MYTNIACAGNEICNCQNNDDVWGEDDGWLTDKEDLPVTAIYVFNTGGNDEFAEVTLGPLTCWGLKN